MLNSSTTIRHYFFPAGAYIRYTSILVVALGIMLFSHVRNDRFIETTIFAVLFLSSVSLYSYRKEIFFNKALSLIGSNRKWLIFNINQVVFQMSKDSRLYLKENYYTHDVGKTSSCWLILLCDGELMENSRDSSSPHEIFTEHWFKRRKRLAEIAFEIARELKIEMVDEREHRYD